MKSDAAVLCEADSWSQWGRLVLATSTGMRGAQQLLVKHLESRPDSGRTHEPSISAGRGERPSCSPASRATAEQEQGMSAHGSDLGSLSPHTSLGQAASTLHCTPGLLRTARSGTQAPCCSQPRALPLPLLPIAAGCRAHAASSPG